MTDRTPMTEPWKPVPVSDALMAFPASVVHLMPPTNELAGMYAELQHDPWAQLFFSMFSKGIDGEHTFLMPKEIDGEKIDGETAWRHLRALCGSFEPKHQHKEAAFIFLCQQWWEWGLWMDGEGQTYQVGEIDDEIKKELGW